MNTYLVEPTLDASSWVDLLRRRAIQQPEQKVFRFLGYEEGQDASMTYGELDRRARAIAAPLQALGVVGQRVMIMYPPSIEYITAFFGCLYAGATAVPTYPPRTKRNLSLHRLQHIIKDAQPVVGLTTPEILATLKNGAEAAPLVTQLHWLTSCANTAGAEDFWQETHNESDTLAYLQYTSGSTGSPKGVMVSHGNLLHNAKLSREHFEFHPGTHMVNWLPPYHDLGLILSIFQPIYTGFLVTFMSPFSFVQHPLRWLHAISDFKGTATCAPNFAYELCSNKVTDADLATLDLSSLEWVGNIAEPVRSTTIERFCKIFAPCGLRPEALYPAYGLAEATLFVTGGMRTAQSIYLPIQKSALERQQVVPAAPECDDAYTLVGCGHVLGGQKVIVVDPETCIELPPAQIGEIWIAGPSVTQGYWNKPEATAEVFEAYLADTGEGPFLRSGDLGFFKEEEIYVTGRRKDVIIVDGRNHYPQDIELTAGTSHPAIRPGLCVAFSVDIEDQEQLVVIAEIDQRYCPTGRLHASGTPLDPQAVIKAIRQSISEQHDVHAHQILLLKPEGIQKTSSGKVKRRTCRTDYLLGDLDAWVWGA